MSARASRLVFDGTPAMRWIGDNFQQILGNPDVSRPEPIAPTMPIEHFVDEITQERFRDRLGIPWISWGPVDWAGVAQQDKIKTFP